MSNKTLITANDRIFVAGHRGMAGSAICRALTAAGYGKLLTASREELDLLDPQAVRAWFELMKPDVVVLAAAKRWGESTSTTPTRLIFCWITSRSKPR